MLIPSRILVLAAVGPVVLAIIALVDASMTTPMLITDAVIVAIAAFDALLGWKAHVSITRRAPRVLSIGRPNVIHLDVRSTARRSLSIRIQQDLFQGAVADPLPLEVDVPSRGKASARYRLVPTRRGAYEIGDHFVRYGSPLGLWMRQQRIPAATPVKVYPDIQAVRAYDLLAAKDKTVAGVRAMRRKGGENEFERLREYRTGDEFKSIDWKASARQSRLISREYQQERNQSVLFLLDAGRLMAAEANGLSLFNHALNATLMLSHVAARAGDHVGLLAFSDTVKSYAPPEGGARATARIVQAAYHLHPEIRETNFAAAIEQIGLRVKKRTLIVVFTQVVDDVSAQELLRQLRGLIPRHLPLLVPFKDMEIEALTHGTATEVQSYEGAAPYVRAAAAELTSFRDRLLRDLRRRGALILDCPPTDLTPALVNRYLEIKARHLL